MLRECAIRWLRFTKKALANAILQYGLGKSTTFVTLAIEKWEAGMPLKDMPRSGRPRIHDARDERLLLRELNKDRELTRGPGTCRGSHGRRIQKQSVEFCADVGSRR